MINVILLIDCSGEFDRKLLRGIVRYSNEHGPWQFYRMPSWYRWDENGEEHILDWAVKWKADAIIGRWNSPSAPLLKKLGIPIVLQNYHDRSKDYSTLTGDYIGTGRMAADFFIKRRFSRFAYFGLKDVIWSEERLQGFAEQVGRIGGSLSTLMIDVPENEARGQIARWLHTLTGPVAMFCCSDSHALIISEICNLEGIRIPEQVALLGVDNDDLLCEFATPPLSSIQPDHERAGYIAAQELNALMTHRARKPRTLVCPVIGIVERESTRPLTPAAHIVRRALEFIKANAAKGIGVKDVVAHLKISRRLADLRFREIEGRSILQTIETRRLELAERALTETERPVKAVARESGYRNVKTFEAAFRRKHGLSPSAFRKR